MNPSVYFLSLWNHLTILDLNKCDLIQLNEKQFDCIIKGKFSITPRVTDNSIFVK